MTKADRYKSLIAFLPILGNRDAFWFCKRNPYLRWRKPVVSVHMMTDPTGKRRRLFKQHILSRDRTGGYYQLLGDNGTVRYVFKLYAGRDEMGTQSIAGEIAEVCGGAVVGRSKSELRGSYQLWPRLQHAYRILVGKD